MSSGWVDMIPTPDFAIEDATKRVDLTLELDQSKQYRVGNIDVLGGENAAAEKIVKSSGFTPRTKRSFLPMLRHNTMSN